MRLLDLFCGAGGSAVGYSRAGFDEIVGVDIKPQPRYPFTFIQADAMTFPLEGFDAIHASPPCQGYTMLNNFLRRDYPLLIEPIREGLKSTDCPFVIENVVGAPLLHPLMLCGRMFGLRLFRHRLFEFSQGLPMQLQPGHSHDRLRAPVRGKGNVRPQAGEVWAPTGHFSDKIGAREAMGVEWMDAREEIAQAIPPAYTEYIGRALIEAIG